MSKTNGEVNKSSTRGAPELIKGDNNYVVTKDPGFVNYAGGDYTLREDSEVFTVLPEFENSFDFSWACNNSFSFSSAVNRVLLWIISVQDRMTS